MRPIHGALAACLLFAAGGHGQTPTTSPEAGGKIQATATLVLTREFCGVHKRESFAIRDVLRIGAAVCPKIESALQGVFTTVNRVGTAPAGGAGTAVMTLTPRFVQMEATRPMMPTSQRKLVVMVEWTALDRTGKTIWVHTIDAQSQHKAGWTSATGNLVEKAAEQLAEKSAEALAKSPELRRCAQVRPDSPGLGK